MSPPPLPRVIYLSNTPRGEALLEWLSGLPCLIVLQDTKNAKVDRFPDYDIGISFLYHHKIPKTEFAVPYRWINFHPGLLPDFRGRNVAYHAIMSGATRFGATMHYMDEQCDTGEIIATSTFEIEPHHTAGDLVDLTHRHLEGLFYRYIPLALRGKLPSTRQEKGTYYKKTPLPDEVPLSAEQARLIRALTVHPIFHASVRIGGRVYKVIPADPPGGGSGEPEGTG